MFGLVISSVVLFVMEGLGLGLILLILDIDASDGFLARQGWLVGPRIAIADLGVGERIQWAALTLLAATLFRTLMNLFQRRLALRMRVGVTSSYQTLFHDQVHQVPLWYLQRRLTGEWVALVINNSRQVGQMLEAGVVLPASVFNVMTYLVISWVVSWKLTLLAMAPLILVILLARPWFSRRLKQANLEFHQQLRALTGLTQEDVAMTRVVRAFNRQEWSRERFAVAQLALNEKDYRLGKWMAMTRPLFELLGVAGFTLIIIAGSYLSRQSSALSNMK